jgi:hypothetical protein
MFLGYFAPFSIFSFLYAAVLGTSCGLLPGISCKTGRYKPCAAGWLAIFILGWLYISEENWGLKAG